MDKGHGFCRAKYGTLLKSYGTGVSGEREACSCGSLSGLLSSLLSGFIGSFYWLLVLDSVSTFVCTAKKAKWASPTTHVRDLFKDFDPALVAACDSIDSRMVWILEKYTRELDTPEAHQTLRTYSDSLEKCHAYDEHMNASEN
ncbi:hypothetical protein N7447_005892 [Penicillium robsamsonii]|uniref:uncharacterized protein n=1 Tax=Penicillium robsamsonii TaxID=1792511 RepID=UPI002547FC78|nr:uncharacterized protein N7447_005892 [Penicillium robsamsonii]KAJ5823552.1 hypothetical protein N7447_005892 [Penicillium robsamsonii]